jgi:transcriptional regulator GlxA family with amidase domain
VPIVIDDRVAHRVAVVIGPGFGPIDFGVAIYSFGFAPYEPVVCGEVPVTETLGGSTIVPAAGLEALQSADTVIVPGYPDPTQSRPSESLVAGLRRAYERGARIASISTGAFALGYAGVLDGHQVTTHWMHLDSLADEFPRADVRRGVLYLSSGQIYTCAGAASGIDMFLHMIRDDLGAAVANQRRRRLVAAPLRGGDQRQVFEDFIPHPDEEAVSAVCAWSLDRLEEPLTLAQFAAEANMSTRNFSRRFIAETGQTPMKWLQAVRVDYARELLETTDKSIDDIARRCGLGTRVNFRRIFTNVVGLGPSQYRSTYLDNQVRETTLATVDVPDGVDPVVIDVATGDVSMTARTVDTADETPMPL